MPLSAGTRLGPYEIQSPLGAGGMGEVAVNQGGTTFEPGLPKPLFAMPGNLRSRSYAVAGDGRRFLVSRPLEVATAIPITVVLNWQASLKR